MTAGYQYFCEALDSRLGPDKNHPYVEEAKKIASPTGINPMMTLSGLCLFIVSTLLIRRFASDVESHPALVVFSLIMAVAALLSGSVLIVKGLGV